VFDHLLRALKDRLFAPIARWIGPWLAPSAISSAALVAGIAAAVAVAQRLHGLALLLWLVNRILDGLDGTQARVHGTQSDFGGYVDILADFVVYAAIPLGILYADASRGQALAAAALLASFFVNAASWMYLAAILERRHAGATSRNELTTITMPPGLVAGAETVVLYALMLALPALRVPLFWLMALLVSATVVQRLIWARRHL